MRIVVMFYEMLLISKQHFQFKSVQFCGKSYFINSQSASILAESNRELM